MIAMVKNLQNTKKDRDQISWPAVLGFDGFFFCFVLVFQESSFSYPQLLLLLYHKRGQMSR